MTADAPRLRAYLPHAEQKPVLFMPRQDWDTLGLELGKMVPVAIEKTPMAKVSSDASVLGVVAQRFSNATAEVLVYRDDPKDNPNRVNADVYLAWLDLPSHQSFNQIVQAASTQDNTNLRHFLNENVVLVKQDPDDRHRGPHLPPTVRMTLRADSSTSSTGAV